MPWLVCPRGLPAGIDQQPPTTNHEPGRGEQRGNFEAMGIPRLAGRDFTGAEDTTSAVVIVSRRLAARQWPGEDPVGHTLTYQSDSPERAIVIGVVEDIRHAGLVGEVTPHVYFPATSGRRRFIVAAVAGQADPASLVPQVRQALAGIDPDLPATIRPLSAIVRENRFQWSIGSMALAAFGTTALLLAALGLYGVIAFSVSERQRELAIRLAVGARAQDIRALVLREGLRLTALGLALGLVLAIIASRGLASQLVGVSAFDPLTIGAVLLLFAALGVATTARLAFHAGSTAPQHVLRGE
ncbi:MAG: FtsX-like permease family protein [Longimicrobiales bacterium]